MEELERLEDLEKASSIERIVALSSSLDEFLSSSILPSDLLDLLNGIPGEATNTSQRIYKVLTYFLTYRNPSI